MQIDTHKSIDRELCGRPVEAKPGEARVELVTVERMAADDMGLVHGGFIFGQADYAAMLAVNDPNVVLGAAEVKFLKPVKVGETVVAEAKVETEKGRKRVVPVTVTRDGEPVFEGVFTCFVLDSHVLG